MFNLQLTANRYQSILTKTQTNEKLGMNVKRHFFLFETRLNIVPRVPKCPSA